MSARFLFEFIIFFLIVSDFSVDFLNIGSDVATFFIEFFAHALHINVLVCYERFK